MTDLEKQFALCLAELRTRIEDLEAAVKPQPAHQQPPVVHYEVPATPARIYAATLKCPDCDSLLVLRSSYRGKFFGCSTFPTCRGIVPYDPTIKTTEGSIASATTKPKFDSEPEPDNIPF